MIFDRLNAQIDSLMSLDPPPMQEEWIPENGWCRWRTIAGRPVLISTDGIICGGKIPRSWQGHHIYDQPWRDTITDEEELAYIQDVLDEEQTTWKVEKERQAKTFRRFVLSIGGVKIDSDYEELPIWCRRKDGKTLDQIGRELTELDMGPLHAGFHADLTSEDVYQLLFQYAPSQKTRLK